MGKRSDFPRQARDLYKTPRAPVLALSAFLTDVDGFAEPFVGDGAIVRTLRDLGHSCGFACDIEPLGAAQEYAEVKDALDVTEADLADCTHVISNPPWPAPRGRGEPTLSFIRHLSALRPTWLLLPADFMHNAYASEVMSVCHEIVPVGRVKWIEGSKHTGMENAAWLRLDSRLRPLTTVFHSRRDRPVVLARWLEDLL